MQGRRYQLQPGRTWAKISLLVMVAAVLLGSLTSLSPSAAAQAVRTSALTPDAELLRQTDLPAVLDAADAQRYRRIFRLQGIGQWAAADREIAQLEDKLLLGAVEAQRYLHPHWHPHFGELARWMARHADEPSAKAVYALALKHRPAGALLARPIVAPLVPRD